MADVNLVEAVNMALAHALEHDPSVVLMGEDIGVNGGVFRATVGLQARFGPQRVIPNFVGGVEMASPHGFTDIDRAVASTTEGLEFFMSKGIIPRFTTWCPEPTSDLGRQVGPPLEYFVKLLHAWRTVFEHHELSAPPGYGRPGVGSAEFSVSAFMDVIRVERLPKGREIAEV